MFFAIMIAAVASLVAPAEELKGSIQAAIWADLQLNAMIGNGNRLASLWFNAGSDTRADLHIQDLKCAQTRSGQRCSFDLARDDGEVAVLGEAAPDRLTCVAALYRADDDWAVVHKPPRHRGHSQTSMQCAVPKT
jgi:hypothetical protein